LDEGFIRRTYRTSAWVLLLVVLFTTGLGAFRVAWSIVAGAALGLLVLRGFDWAVHVLFAPGRTPAKGAVAKLLILKLPAMALLLYLVVNSGWFHLPAFAGGVALIQAVIFLKALGLYLVQREEDRCRRAGETSAE
jgi:hypothetical protein